METSAHFATTPLAASQRGASQLHARGFTLFELMIVLAIAAIMATLAAPAMRGFLQNQQGISAASNFVTALNYARSEAIKEDLSSVGTCGSGTGVCICASTNGTSCDPGGNWSDGWIVLSSANATPLEVTGALQSGLNLAATPATPEIDFQPDGTTTLPALVEFTLCDSRGASYAREVEVDLTGRIQAAAQAGYDVSGTTGLACP